MKNYEYALVFILYLFFFFGHLYAFIAVLNAAEIYSNRQQIVFAQLDARRLITGAGGDL